MSSLRRCASRPRSVGRRVAEPSGDLDDRPPCGRKRKSTRATWRPSATLHDLGLRPRQDRPDGRARGSAARASTRRRVSISNRSSRRTPARPLPRSSASRRSRTIGAVAPLRTALSMAASSRVVEIDAAARSMIGPSRRRASEALDDHDVASGLEPSWSCTDGGAGSRSRRRAAPRTRPSPPMLRSNPCSAAAASWLIQAHGAEGQQARLAAGGATCLARRPPLRPFGSDELQPARRRSVGVAPWWTARIDEVARAVTAPCWSGGDRRDGFEVSSHARPGCRGGGEAEAISFMSTESSRSGRSGRHERVSGRHRSVSASRPG